MHLFNRKSPPPESSGHAGDDQTLEQLVQHGANLAEPRHWIHYLYFEDEPAARSGANAAVAAGWEVGPVSQAAAGDGTWIVMPQQHAALVDATSVRLAREFFEGLVTGVPGADYDGWEASL